jgi:MFS family permease
MFAPGAPQLAKEFNITNSTVEAMTVSLYVLGFAFGPLLLAPLSELYGRLIIYSGPMSIGGGTVADITPQEERGKAMALFAMGPLLGPVRLVSSRDDPLYLNADHIGAWPDHRRLRVAVH